jgi:nitric oxide reductase NorQ protein
VAPELAARLVQLAQAVRHLDGAGLREVASTRVLVAAGRLVAAGLDATTAARAAIAGPLTDDPVVTRGLIEMVDAYLGDAAGD